MTFLSFCLSAFLFVPQGPALPTARKSPRPPVIVIGLVGGFVRHDDSVHSVVQLAATLRKDFPDGVYVQVFGNHNGEKAHAEVLRRLDADHDGKLSAEEKEDARIILYGHSWGGSQAITLARELQHDGVPVRLTIQVDSVAKSGEDDAVIPANVAEAVNFYQTDGLLHGVAHIRAADPARTRILGNYRMSYKAHPIRCDQYPWYDRMFMKAHIEIECDPAVWGRVESLIRSEISSAYRDTSTS